MKRGFTLVEVLTCVAIIGVLAALSFPVFRQVLFAAKRSAASSNLHQLYLATALYRTDNDGDAMYGSPSEMGLPADTGELGSPFMVFMKPLSNLKRSPCGTNRSWYQPYPWEPDSRPTMDIIYRPSDAATFGAYARRYRSNSLLFYDVNCDDADAPIMNGYLRHRGLAVLVEGQLVVRYKRGLMLGNDSWWSTPEGE